MKEAGIGETAQWVKCLLHKHEDLNLDPSTHIKVGCGNTYLYPRLWG